jgi:hypothetical protein
VRERAPGHVAVGGVGQILDHASPPQRLIAWSPAVPSSSIPDSTTPITRDEQLTAAERNSGSIAGPRPVLPRARGARAGAPGPRAGAGRPGPRRSARLEPLALDGGRRPQRPGGVQDVGQQARSLGAAVDDDEHRGLQPAGSPRTISRTASRPPDDPPMTITSRLARATLIRRGPRPVTP